MQERLLARHPGGLPQIRTLLARLREADAPYIDREAVFVSAERLKSLPTRVLFVVGDRDWLGPLEVVLEAYRALSDAALWVIPGGGHGAVWDSEQAGAMFPEIVYDFFEGRLVE